MKKRIMVMSRYPVEGASSRLRLLQYLPFITTRHNDFYVTSFFNEKYMLFLNGKRKLSYLNIVWCYIRRFFHCLSCVFFDTIWVEKEIFPYLPSWFERFFVLVGKRVVVDYDDAVYLQYKHGNLKKILLGNKIEKVMKHASLVIAGNRNLADKAKLSGAENVLIIPTVIDIRRYPQDPSYNYRDKVSFIGWIGSPSTEKYLIEMKDTLSSICEKFAVKLLVVGASDNILSHFKHNHIDLASWSADSEVELIKKMDIGIMPLIDSEWEKGKCGYKIIQYMAVGIPVIASPIGANVDIINDSKSGLLASTQDEWISACSTLISSTALREMYGKNGRAAVENIYCVQQQYKAIKESLIIN